MSERAKQVHLTIEFDGDRVTGELRDERGAVSAFSGWLDLISALDSLSTADQARGVASVQAIPEGKTT